MRLKSFLTVYLLMLSLLGCDIKEAREANEVKEVRGGQDVQEHKSQESPVKAFEKSSVTYRIVPLEDPNAYGIDVAWPSTKLPIFIRRDTENSFVKAESGRGSHRILVTGGSKINIEVELRDTDEKNTLESVKLEVTVPRDWFVDKPIYLSENRKINCGRLFIREGAVLQLRNFDVDLFCDELISDGGTIETFPLGSIAEQKGASGRSGGTSNLRFRKARGVLYVYLRGESGANGRNGIRGSIHGCRGQDGGGGGGTGSLNIYVKEPSELEVSGSVIPGNGGIPGNNLAVYGDLEAISRLPPRNGPCDPAGGFGTPGSSGSIGKSCLQISSQAIECSK